MSAPEDNGSVEVAGRRLAWRIGGAGPPLLLVNGYAASGADWDPQFLAGLAGAFEVFRPDNRGTGRSELGAPAEVSIDGMAADLEALLDALGLESAAVAGWSMGGFVAQRLAARAPRRVEALVLLATDAGGPGAIPAAPDVLERLCDHTSSPREQAGRLISVLSRPGRRPTSTGASATWWPRLGRPSRPRRWSRRRRPWTPGTRPSRHHPATALRPCSQRAAARTW